ncbi:MAG: FMN-dependent NADH-azoreductase [Acidobacteriaceae bacterium]
MATLLQIDSSPRSSSISNTLTAKFVTEWKRQNPSGTVVHHNVSKEKLPHLDEATIGAFFTPAESRTPEQTASLALSDQFVDELLAADVIVLGVPMWNFGVPAALKAWIDLIARVGRTFAYTSSGVTSLLPPNKKVYVFASRGGAYSGDSSLNFLDQQEPYLRTFFGFIGLTDVTFIYAENQSRGPEAASASLAKAEAALVEVFA